MADVLPSLGEEGVRTCTLRDLVPEGAAAEAETDPVVASLKSSAGLVEAIDAAVGLYEEPPTRALTVDTPWAEARLTGDDWAEAFAAVEPGTPHNEARDEIRDALVEILADQHDDEVPADRLRDVLRGNREVNAALNRAWPLLEATDVVGDLWSVPAYLQRCAPWLNREQVQALQRAEPQAWTLSDLPLLDAARHRLGDPRALRRAEQHRAAIAAERAERAQVVEHLIAADDSEMQVMSMLRGPDLQDALVDDPPRPAGAGPDGLAGPFAHVVVDEAQELTDAEWQMVRRRCPSGSVTVVGDRAQARHGFGETWRERLERVGFVDVEQAGLHVNYRTPEEVMLEAEPVIRVVLPDANVPTSIRRSGIPVRHGTVAELAGILDGWLATHDEGIACVIARKPVAARPRVRSLTPELTKGLEFDLVVLIDAEEFGDGVEGAVDRYVAMTRATQRLVMLTSSPAPG